MKFLLALLLIIPIIAASDEHKSESHEDTKGEKEQKKAQVLRETVKGNTEFAINFFKHVTSSQSKDSHAENVVISPLSISSAFSMLSLGARTETHQEIWEGLRLNNTHCKEKDFHRAYSSLLQALNEPKSSLQVNIGNAVFVQDTLALRKSFEDDIQHHYHAEIKKTNFINSQEAKKEINEYVKNKTEGKIEELFEELSAQSKMVTVNYVLFRGEWQIPFHPSGTRTGKFFLDSNTTVDVQMMNHLGLYNSYHDTQLPCTVVELPYKDNASMIIAVAEPGKIHEAVHKAVLNVDEVGTVASAATGMEMIPIALFPSVMVNNPFVLVIYDKNTNTILFIGSIRDPTKS
uniref:Thyroxine-binding globulin n=1 Tax=Pyxicephalus adspersus TaxID=30357 RepID=A0AAV2ZEN7_PYXAD|nr:TPA: hypothetical protein GDO54_005489 [Pyxicephalus adspersus]